MKIFEQVFPAGVVVSVLTTESGTVVRAFTQRQHPTWLHKVDPVSVAQRKQDTEQLKAEVLRLVRALPGRAKSFYTQLGMDEGGVKGSQARKEKAIDDLLSSGALRRVQLEKAVGRKNHELYAV